MRKSLGLLLLLLLTSCFPNHSIRLDDMIAIRKGMSTENLQTMLDEQYQSTFTLMENDEEYTVFLYSMQTGTKKEQSTSYHSSGISGTMGASGTFVTTQYNAAVFTPYAFVFKGDKLFFWGFLYEFGREDNETVANLGVKINNRNQ